MWILTIIEFGAIKIIETHVLEAFELILRHQACYGLKFILKRKSFATV